MTTVQEMWEKKDTYTARASEISRTLCLSGLAVVWIFRTPMTNGSFLAPTLLWVSGLIVLALLLDLVQYVVGANRTAKVARLREQELKKNGQPTNTTVHYPASHPVPMNLIWRAKITVVIVAWALLLVHVGLTALNATLPAISK